MIRILITAILYLISFFTQAQTDPKYKDENLKMERELVSVGLVNKSYTCNAFLPGYLDSQRNQVVKFEVTDKHLTFETK